MYQGCSICVPGAVVEWTAGTVEFENHAGGGEYLAGGGGIERVEGGICAVGKRRWCGCRVGALERYFDGASNR